MHSACHSVPRTSEPGHGERKACLESLLLKHRLLWEKPIFGYAVPDWGNLYPGLMGEVLDLDDTDLEALAGDNPALIRLVAEHVPALSALLSIIVLPRVAADPLPGSDRHLAWDVPGRKRQQIDAYAAALGRPQAPLLEWCAGKGHLGRLLAKAWSMPVESLEIEPGLCAAGADLARRARVESWQRFEVADVLATGVEKRLTERHAVALHACGDLHRSLLTGTVAAAAPALDVAPCCYDRTSAEIYIPLAGGPMRLTRNQLRLAVTDTTTASGCERDRSRKALAWKLAWVELCRGLSGEPIYRPFRPVPDGWLRADFESFLRRLAEREGFSLPPNTDYAALEAAGQAAAARVRRLELVRLAFRRALEVWLLLDMAVYLEGHGYRVSVRQFCPDRLTPRNLLLSARRT